MRERRIVSNVAKKKLPLHFEPIVEHLIVRHLEPMVTKVEWVGDVGVPDRTRRIDAMLGQAVAQAGDGTAQGTVYLQAEKFVAVDTKRPGGIDLRDDTAV